MKKYGGWWSFCLALCCAVGLGGCSSEVWEVEPYMSPCMGVAPGLCLRYKVDGKARSSYSSVKGFQFEWGVRKTISITRSPVLNPPADGSSVRYAQNEVIKTEKVKEDTTFTTHFTKDWLRKNDKGDFSLVGKAIDCKTNQQCDALKTMFEQKDRGQTYKVIFAYPTSPSGALILKSLAKHDS